MCGIFGILQPGVADEGRLRRSLELIAHRGPDHQAIYRAAGIGLAHARLSLVDLNERSHQPFWDASGRHVIVYNGEIYNFRELGAELEQRGLRLRTTSDTEVLLEALVHLGANEVLPRLEGMFAFAWYDTQEQTLLLARDRFGIKPLFTMEDGDRFLFASESRAFRPWVDLAPDVPSILSYLIATAGPTMGHSLFGQVRIVPPGAVVRVAPGGRAEISQFTTLADLWDGAERERLARLPAKGVVDALDEALQASVRSQLFADAPVGTFASGGVDSSLITAMAARVQARPALFHAEVVGPDSEHEAAVILARHLKLELNSVQVHPQDFLDRLADVTEHYGQPFSYHPNSVPFYLVSCLVRDSGVKGMLSGEGADECFMGYQHLLPNLRALWPRSPLRLVRNAGQVARHFFRLSRFQMAHRGPSLVRDDRHKFRLGLLDRFETELERDEVLRAVQARKHGPVPLRDMTTLVWLGYHLRTLLHRNDALGMAAGVEARFPFLDRRVVGLAVNMPFRHKMRFTHRTLDRRHPFLVNKWVLRQVARRYLPRELWRRPKRGFLAPIYHHVRVSPEFFRSSFVGDMLDLTWRQMEHLLRWCSSTERVKLLHLEVWAHVCLFGLPKDQITSRLRQHVTLPGVGLG
jgi:asparagine synthase (glutamine-hydrolysing)